MLSIIWSWLPVDVPIVGRCCGHRLVGVDDADRSGLGSSIARRSRSGRPSPRHLQSSVRSKCISSYNRSQLLKQLLARTHLCSEHGQCSPSRGVKMAVEQGRRGRRLVAWVDRHRGWLLEQLLVAGCWSQGRKVTVESNFYTLGQETWACWAAEFLTKWSNGLKSGPCREIGMGNMIPYLNLWTQWGRYFPIFIHAKRKIPPYPSPNRGIPHRGTGIGAHWHFESLFFLSLNFHGFEKYLENEIRLCRSLPQLPRGKQWYHSLLWSNLIL
jgi:hypothetical protein